VIRSKEYINFPENSKKIVGDDSFLPDYIIYTYGKGKIRIRYDSIVYYDPIISLINHFKCYKRIYLDLKNLKRGYPEFKQIREDSILILNKEYIKKLKWNEQVKFLVFTIIRKIERSLFKLEFKNKDPSQIWKYNKK